MKGNRRAWGAGGRLRDSSDRPNGRAPAVPSRTWRRPDPRSIRHRTRRAGAGRPGARRPLRRWARLEPDEFEESDDGGVRRAAPPTTCDRLFERPAARHGCRPTRPGRTRRSAADPHRGHQLTGPYRRAGTSRLPAGPLPGSRCRTRAARSRTVATTRRRPTAATPSTGFRLLGPLEGRRRRCCSCSCRSASAGSTPATPGSASPSCCSALFFGIGIDVGVHRRHRHPRGRPTDQGRPARCGA